MSSQIYAGLMSGTSLDGVDLAVVDFEPARPRLIYCATTAYADSIRRRLRDLCQGQTTSIAELYSLDAELGDIYAEVVNRGLRDAGLEPVAVTAIGCHGQTISHGPDTRPSYTAQIGDPNRVAAYTGITTVADFRRKDIALGGQAAPLAPAFHRYMFSQAGEERALVNIGGIANLTWLPGDTRAPIIGFDTGPGNTLCDYWINRHRGQDFDRDGDWARGGEVQDELLQDMLANETYFSAKPPKSTGTEYFGPDWLTAFVKRDIDPRDLQATLVELTAATIADALDSLPAPASSVFVCGGGAHNVYLLQRLQRRLPQCRVDTTASLGLDPDFVEAAAFAWLARERIEQRPGNVPEVTNAEREAILGGVYSPD